MGKQVKAIVSPPRPISSFPQDALIPPWLLEHAKRLRAGNAIAYDLKFRVPCKWENEQVVEQWLRQGDMDRLAALLKKDPFRFAHPVIRAQLHYLGELATHIEVSDPTPVPEEGNPTGTRQVARNALLKIFQGMWNAFSPGTLSMKQRKRRGHPRKWHDWEIEGFLEDDYNPLMEHLELLELQTDDLTRIHGESQTAYLNKLTQVVRQLDSRTTYSWKSVKTKSGDSVIKRGVIPLRVARLIARQAIPKNRVQKHILVMGLFAHYWSHDYTKWKRLHRIIERGEEMFSHLHRRKTLTSAS